MRRFSVLMLGALAVVTAGVVVAARPAAAASTVTLGASTCGLGGPDVTLNGTWNAGTSTCVVTGFAAVGPGSTLTIPSGVTLTDSSSAFPFNDSGSVVNNGTVSACSWNDFGNGVATNTSTGTFMISALGSCSFAEHEVYVGGQFQNYGTYSNSGTLVVDGYLAGASFTNFCGSSYGVTGTVVTVLGGTLVMPTGCPQSIAFTGPASGIVGGSYIPVATATSGLPVSFSVDSLSTGCSPSGPAIDFTGGGTCLVDATQTGDSIYAAALMVQVPTVIIVPVQPQTITFGPLADVVVGSPPITVSATATSGLPVSFASLTPTVCQVSGVAVDLLTLGQCTVEASQLGDATWKAATPVDQSFNVVAVVSVVLPRQFRTERGSELFVAFGLVDANNAPIPDAIAGTADMVVSFDNGPPVTAFYSTRWRKFLAELPTSRTMPMGTYPLTISSDSPSVPVETTTVQVKIWQRPTRDTPWDALLNPHSKTPKKHR